MREEDRSLFRLPPPGNPEMDPVRWFAKRNTKHCPNRVRILPPFRLLHPDNWEDVDQYLMCTKASRLWLIGEKQTWDVGPNVVSLPLWAMFQ